MKINKWKDSFNWAVIDTETTGMGKKDQIIELTLMSSNGDILFDSLIKPTVPIHIAAMSTHGITAEMLENAPLWTDVMHEFERVASKFETILIYNESFDIRLISQTYAYYNLVAPAFNYDCVMAAFKEYSKAINYPTGGKISLDKACDILGINKNIENRHRSLGDCALTRELILNTPIIKKNENLERADFKSNISISSMIDCCLDSSSSMVELHKKLSNSGIDMVLIGPNMEKKVFNGCLFYRGNEKNSGSKIGKNYSLNKLIERGMVYSESDFDYFYMVFLNKVKLEQSNDLRTLEKINRNIRNIYNDSTKPLKTTFKLFIEYFNGVEKIRVIYKTGILNNSHSQTKLYPDKLATMQLHQIKIYGRDEIIRFKYDNIYSLEENGVTLISNEEKNFIGANALSRMLSSNFDKGLAQFIESCIKGKMYSSSSILMQYIFNQENNDFEKIQRETRDYKINKSSISANLAKD